MEPVRNAVIIRGLTTDPNTGHAQHHRFVTIIGLPYAADKDVVARYGRESHICQIKTKIGLIPGVEMVFFETFKQAHPATGDEIPVIQTVHIIYDPATDLTALDDAVRAILATDYLGYDSLPVYKRSTFFGIPHRHPRHRPRTEPE